MYIGFILFLIGISLSITYLAMSLYMLCILVVMSCLKDVSSCTYSEIRDEIKFMHLCMQSYNSDVCYLQEGACVHFVICDSIWAYHMADKMTFALNI